jgi:hypothetical protein
MQWLELTSDEVEFLTLPSSAPDPFQARLTRKLAAMLTARLRLPVQVAAHPVTAPVDATGMPIWQPDAALATLWLTRRLGGWRATGTTSFVPPTLLHALDAMLAECWLDVSAQAMASPGMAWTIASDLIEARLAVQLPHHTIDMTRWARGVIQHG